MPNKSSSPTKSASANAGSAGTEQPSTESVSWSELKEMAAKTKGQQQPFRVKSMTLLGKTVSFDSDGNRSDSSAK